MGQCLREAAKWPLPKRGKSGAGEAGDHACGAEVEIPKLGTMPTDSSIMRILGVNDELRRKMDEYDAEHANQATAEQNVPPPDPDLPPPQTRKKVCPQCDWEIDAGYRICPHCRYYFMK